MSVPLEELRQAMLRIGFLPHPLQPVRLPGGITGYELMVVYDPGAVTPLAESEPEQMIPRPADGWIHVDQLAKMRGIGPKTIESIAEYIEILASDGDSEA